MSPLKRHQPAFSWTKDTWEHRWPRLAISSS